MSENDDFLPSCLNSSRKSRSYSSIYDTLDRISLICLKIAYSQSLEPFIALAPLVEAFSEL